MSSKIITADIQCEVPTAYHNLSNLTRQFSDIYNSFQKFISGDWRVNEDRHYSKRKHRWTGHVLRHDRLLHEITEGRIRGGGKRIQIKFQTLYDLANTSNGGLLLSKSS